MFIGNVSVEEGTISRNSDNYTIITDVSDAVCVQVDVSKPTCVDVLNAPKNFFLSMQPHTRGLGGC